MVKKLVLCLILALALALVAYAARPNSRRHSRHSAKGFSEEDLEKLSRFLQRAGGKKRTRKPRAEKPAPVPVTEETAEEVEEADSENVNYKITVDPQNANEWWIQLIASPEGLIKSIDLNTQVGFFRVPNVDWDNGKGKFFVAKPSAGIPRGSPLTAQLNLKSGQQVQISMTYSPGSSFTMSGPGSAPSTGGSGGSSSGSGSGSGSQSSASTVKPSTDPKIKKFINAVAEFHRGGGGPTAHITGEDSLRARNKQALKKAMDNLGIADKKARAFLFAAFGLESEQMYDSNGNAQRDFSKDHDKWSKNISPLNMNVDMLRNYVKYDGNLDALNKIGNIKQVVEVAIEAVNKLGLAGFLNFHRGGRSAYDNPNKYKSQYKLDDFKDGLFNIMKAYMNDPSLENDGRKVWANIAHV